ncbi:hypothetical protein MtrunA17_Chr1g0155391 [Medicago truncatula]|uniref:Uncharacterized protein n=1 Tax=Medicago truncatula TaxID=3880 RepID=A0A396JJH7_MEDTR|nr:hypothetical protein MtrunA17_Chr1g0155391 [Medicago truncatula]
MSVNQHQQHFHMCHFEMLGIWLPLISKYQCHYNDPNYLLQSVKEEL